MNQIAAEAQIGPGTLYRRYRNKSELCLDLMKDNLVLLFEDIEAYLEKHQGASPNERFRGILGLFIRFRENKAQLLTGVEESPSAGRPKSSRSASPLYQELHQLFVKLFDEMAARGQPRTDSVFRADMLLTSLTSESYLFQRNERGYSPEEIVEQVILIFGAT
jgi:AcrR family transcriptional regulator